MNFRISILAIIAWVVFTGCNTEPSVPDRTIISNKYENTAIGLRITFPKAWAIKTDQVFGSTKVDILAVGLPINAFAPNLSVIIEPHSGPTTMAEILPGIKASLTSQVADLANFADTIYTLNGKELGEIQYETAMNGALYHYLQMFFINNGKDISMTFTDKADDFPVNPDIKSIKASISIK